MSSSTMLNLWKDDGTSLSPRNDREVIPQATNGAALGSATVMWSDLFLASGGVINWDNGDVTLTHSANILTLGGGNLAIGANYISNDGDSEGISIDASGNVTVSGQITANNNLKVPDDKGILFGNNDAFLGYYATGPEPDTLILGVPATSGAVIVATYANRNGAYNLAQQSNPTYVIYSATAAGTATNQYILFQHDTKDGIIKTGYTSFSRVKVDDRLEVTAPSFYDDFWVAAGSPWATRTTTGSVAAQTADNGWMRLTTGASATNEESLDWNDLVRFTSTKRPSFKCRIDLEQVTDIEVDVGLMESAGVGTDDYILIKFDASAANTWSLVASAGGATTSDTGAVASTDEVELEFRFTSDTALEWFIDGVSQGTVTSNVPTVGLQPVIAVRTEADAAHYIDVDYVKLWQDRT